VVGPAVRAEGIPPPDNTDFFRESFGPYEPAQHTVDTWIRPQRLLTSCAHRLRKPHRTNRPLTPSVAARLQSPALLAQLCPPSRPPLAMFIATREPALPGTEIALVGLGPWPSQNQGAFHWIDPRSCDRIRLARAPFDVRSRPPRTLSPTANQPRLSTKNCRVKLTRHGVASFWLALYRTGKMRLPNFCNRPSPRAPCRSLGSRITALPGFRRGAGLPHRPPGLNLGSRRDRVYASFDAETKALARILNVLGSPKSQAPPGPAELLTELSEQRSLLSALSAGSEGHHPASDALPRASCRRAVGLLPTSPR
jgi:hypothetical protein